MADADVPLSLAIESLVRLHAKYLHAPEGSLDEMSSELALTFVTASMISNPEQTMEMLMHMTGVVIAMSEGATLESILADMRMSEELEKNR